MRACEGVSAVTGVRCRLWWAAAITGCVTCATGLPAHAQPGTITRVSVSSLGEQADANSSVSAINGNGRIVAFASSATNLVPGDTNGVNDIFVHDCATGVTERVSVSSSGEQANALSEGPVVSLDGRFVGFVSYATNLVPGDTNGVEDAFVHDRLTGVTERVSLSNTGEQANGASKHVSLSADGHLAAFGSVASNLVAGDTNGKWDIFVRDRVAGTTVRVSLGSSQQQGMGDSDYPDMSADGSYIAFLSSAHNIVPGYLPGPDFQLYLRDRLLGETRVLTRSIDGYNLGGADSHDPHISLDGQFVEFWTESPVLVDWDSNGGADIFVYDRETDSVDLVSVSSAGTQGNYPSADGWLSGDGRHVGWQSISTNLVSDDTNRTIDVFLRDLSMGLTERVSLAPGGIQTNNISDLPSVNVDGARVAFVSAATNLVDGDTNGRWDIFVAQTDEPQAYVSGIVSFEGLAPGAVQPPSVELEVRLNGYSIGAWPVPVGSDGSFEAQAPAKVLELSVKPSHWLRRTVAVDASWGYVDGVLFDFINGDASGDNHIGIADISTILLDWRTSDPMADLDGSGSVGLADLSIVLLNFGISGDA